MEGRSFDSQHIFDDATVARSADVVVGEGSVVVGEGSAASEGGDNNINMPEAEVNEFENVEPNMRNPEEYMPIANIVRIMRRALPPHAKVSEDAKETMQECMTEFVSFVTNVANARCQNECRRTITAEDVVSAMAMLGFTDYVQPLCDYMNNYREQVPGRRAARGNAPPIMIPPAAYYVDPELAPPRVDGGEGSSGGGEPST